MWRTYFYEVSKFMHGVYHGQIPDAFDDYFVNINHSHNTRHRHVQLYNLPQPRTERGKRSLKGRSANLILHYIERFGSRLKICKKLFLKILCRSRDTECHTSSWPSDVIAREPINIKSCVGASLYWFMRDDIRGSGRCVTLSISASTQYFQKQFFTYF